MKRLFISMTILVLLILPQFTFGSDVDELKAESERWLQAFNSMDADTIAKMTHPGLVVVEANDPFPFVYPTPETFKEALQNWFSTLDSINFTSFNPQYRIVENTGIIWCYSGGRVKPKGGSLVTSYSRMTMTFVKSDGKWRMLMYHFSRFPLDDLK